MSAGNRLLQIHHQQILREKVVGACRVPRFQSRPDGHQQIGIARALRNDAACAEATVLVEPAVAAPGAKDGLHLRRAALPAEPRVRVRAAGLLLDPAVDARIVAREADQQLARWNGHLVRAVGLDDHRPPRNLGEPPVVAFEVVLRSRIVRWTAGDREARRRMRRREPFDLRRERDHRRRVAPLTAKDDEDIDARERRGQRGERGLLLVFRQQVNGVVRLAPDEAADARVRDKPRLPDERLDVQRTVRVVRHGEDRQRSTQLRRRHAREREGKGQKKAKDGRQRGEGRETRDARRQRPRRGQTTKVNRQRPKATTKELNIHTYSLLHSPYSFTYSLLLSTYSFSFTAADGMQRCPPSTSTFVPVTNDAASEQR